MMLRQISPGAGLDNLALPLGPIVLLSAYWTCKSTSVLRDAVNAGMTVFAVFHAVQTLLGSAVSGVILGRICLLGCGGWPWMGRR